MTAPNGLPLASDGTGRGKKIHTKPPRKKRGAAADRTEVIALNRKKYRNAANIPVAEIASTIDPNKPLTEKAKAFVKFWAMGDSITAASARAGYGDGASYAYRLVHFPQVKTLYLEEKRLYEEAGQVTRKEVIDGLRAAVQHAIEVSEPSSEVAGWREIAKICGYYQETKRTIDVNVRGMDRLERMSDAELMKMIKEGATDLLLEHSGEESTDA